MKKLGFLTLVVVLLLVVVCALGVSATTVERGNIDVLAGYEAATVPSDAIAVSTAQDFAAMQADGVYYLNADITLTTAYGEFAGKLYGNGHTVTATGVTVFDKLNGAEIYDLTLEGNVSGTGTRVGGLATEAYDSAVVGVTNKATVTNAGNSMMIVGGVLGYAENTTVRYCVNYGTVSGGSTANGEARPGGIVGEIDNVNGWLVIENCVNYGNINGINQTGGILARAQNSATVTVKNCVNFGRVYVGSSDSGAIAGKIICAGTATVENCINTGRVEGGTQVGMVGFVNAQNFYITNCHNGCFLGCTTDCEHGVMTSRGGNLAAFVGGSDSERAYGNSVMVISGCTNTADLNGGGHTAGILSNVTAGRLTVENCSNSGDITTTSGAVGGIGALISNDTSACLNATFRNCVNTGKVKTANGVGGGIVAYCDAVEAVFENCFNGCQSGCTASCDHGKVECTSHGAGILANRDTRSVANSKTVVKSCTNTGRIATSASSSGGVCGWLGSHIIEITNCVNGCQNGCTSCDHGVVSITANSNPGGIVGCVEGTNTITLKDCINNAALSNGRTGGIVGGCWSTANLIFDNCTNNGNINSTSTSNLDAGGILAFIDNAAANVTFKNCVNNGNITTPHDSSRVGGIAGVVTVANLTIENCTNNGTLTLQGYGAGIVARTQVSGKVQLKGVINNGNVSSANQYCSGVFGWVTGTTNISCIDAHNKGNITCKGSVGGILGNWSNGAATLYFENCSNTGTLTGALDAHVGGIIAWADKADNVITIKNCHNTSDLTSDKFNVAGIAGLLAGNVYIENCSNSGNMTQTTSTHEDSGAAGIVGLVKNGGEGTLTIIGCSNTGNMTSVDGNAAGILGRSFAANSTIIKNCTNSGSCTTTANERYQKDNGSYKDNCAGGIAGIVTSVTITIENCHNGCFSGCTTNCTHGQVTCNSRYAGGILAYNYTTTSIINIKNCSNSGKIHALEYVGGIAARLDNKNLTIENCSNGCVSGCTPAAGEYCVHGMVTNTNDLDFGGILGISNSGETDYTIIKNCYNNGRINGYNRGGGIAGVVNADKILVQGNVNYGDVTTKDNYAGMIVGRVDSWTADGWIKFIDNTNHGTFNQTASYVGGMVGYSESAALMEFINCANYGDLRSDAASGIIMSLGGKIKEASFVNCYNEGNIHANGGGRIGGIVGEIWIPVISFVDCTNKGAISNDSSNDHMGGIAGAMLTVGSLYFENCVNYGNVTSGATNNGRPGGILGGSEYLGRNLKVGETYTTDEYGVRHFVTTHAKPEDYDDFVGEDGKKVYIATAYCTGLTMIDCINYGDVTSGNYPGGLVSRLDPCEDAVIEFIGCENHGNITGAKNHIGGIIGLMGSGVSNKFDVSIIDCKNTGKISKSGTAGDALAEIGGLVGTLRGRNMTMKNCVNEGEVDSGTATTEVRAGGLVGTSYGGVDGTPWIFENCINKGKVNGYANKANNKGEYTCDVGGLVGQQHVDAIFESCTNEGAVHSETAGDQWNIASGGFFGSVRAVADVTATNCVNRGKITSAEGAAAGMAGFRHGDPGTTVVSFVNCKNYGEIKADKKYAAGGVGYAYKSVEMIGCENHGKVTCPDVAGGLFGRRQADTNYYATFVDCHNYAEISGGLVGGIISDYDHAKYGVLEGCTNSGKLISTGNVGGMIGRAETLSLKVINCTNSGEVLHNASNNSGGGGMVGYWEGGGDAFFINCLNTGKVADKVDGKARVGGILGVTKSDGDALTCNVTFIGCVNRGEVTSHGNYAGGIASRVDLKDKTITMTDCHNYGNVTSLQSHAGGMIALCAGSSSRTLNVTNCSNHGKVTFTKEGINSEIGGLFGTAHAKANIKNCTNTGEVTYTKGGAQARVGGLVGYGYNNLWSLTDCVNTGDVSSCGYAGGLIGGLNGSSGHTFTNCSNSGKVTSTGGTAYSDGKDAAVECFYAVGGLLGYANVMVTFDNCANIGAVSATANVVTELETPYIGVGGIVGLPLATCVVKNTTNAGNVTFVPGTFDVKWSANSGVGGLVGFGGHGNPLTIENSINNGAVTFETTGTLQSYAGGLVGCNTNKVLTVKNSENYGAVTAKASTTEGVRATAGGIFGYVSHGATITGCKNYGEIYSSGKDWITNAGGLGGLLTCNVVSTITNCENYGKISTSSSAGGMIGFLHSDGAALPTLTGCKNYGYIFQNIDLATGRYAGGMIGYAADNVKLENCENHADVLCSKNRAGGMIGQVNNSATMTLTGCVNTGNVTGGSQTGGIIGNIDGATTNITSCVNSGNITGGAQTGGLVGHNNGKIMTISNSVNTGDVTGVTRVGGIAGTLSNGENGMWSGIQYCYVSGTIKHTGSGASATCGVGGLSGYGYGPNYYSYNVIEADIILVWTKPATLNPEDAPSAAATVSYDNNDSVQMMYNIFTGTIDGGDGLVSYLGQSRAGNMAYNNVEGATKNGNVHHNYAMTAVAYPLVAKGNTSAHTVSLEGRPIQITSGSDAAAIVSQVGNKFAVVNGTVVPVGTENAFKATASSGIAHTTHTYATTLSKDATGHWYACSCGAQKDLKAHTYDNACDATCNDCGYTRTAGAHTYSADCDASCNVCGATRTATGTHVNYDCGTTCKLCGATVAALAHVYTNNCDTTCNTCGATRTVNSHVYSGECDTTCNVCGVTRTATGTHAGQFACSATCKVCGEAVTPGAHTYANGCDASCDLCGAVRTEGLVHVGAYACATECMYCKTAITATGDHVYGTTCDLTCNNCGFVRELPADSHTYTNGCDNSCNNCGFVRADSELTHTYELLCDTTCSTCGKTIAAQQPHTGSFSCDTTCQWCETEIVPGAHTPETACSEICKDCGATVPVEQAHTFANPCDPDCDLCGKTRTELTHTFANDCDKVCEYCDYARDDAELKHTFANACDKVCEYCDYARDDAELVHTYPYPCADKCANCDAELVPGAHTPVSDCAGTCKDCGAAVEATGEHTYSDLCDLDCDVCGVERPTSEAHQYHTDCDTTCNICGFVREVTDTHEFLYACLGCIKCGETTEETVAHTYATECDDTCDVCGYIRTFEEGLKLHTYDNLCDTDCNYGCGLVRPQRAHKGAYLCSTACQWCGAEIEGKDHVYSNACDDTCGYCGEVTREVDTHTGEFACSETCKLCGVAIVGAAHTFANACDTDCDVCGLTREVAPHAGEFACSTVCQHCGVAVTGTDHTFANDCDTDCDVCGATREVGEHVYDNDCDTDCNNCGELREVGEHVYDNACDTDCNTCGATREVDDHTYDNACDTDCNVCGETREPTDHVYSNACDGECNVCGNLREPADHVYDNDSDAVCNVCEAVRQIESDDEDDDKDSEGSEGSDSNDNSNASGSGNTTTTTDEDGSAVGVVITVVMIVLAVVIVVAVVFIGSGSKDQKRSKKFQPSKKNNKGKKSK